MLFKGHQYVRVHNIVTLPTEDENGNSMPYSQKDGCYLVFGKVSALGKSKKGAVKSDYHKIIRDDDGNEISREPIYAVPLEVSGYSLTNLAYGADGYRYLMYDGRFYRSKEKLKKFVEETKAKEAQEAQVA